MEPAVTESPFKRDEPVSGSRFPILLTALSVVVWLGLAVWHWGRMMDDEWDFFALAAVVVLLGALAVVLFRAASAAGQCREQRSFEIMAAAVRPQRRVWMLVAMLGAAGGVCFAVWALRHRPVNDHLRTWLEQRPQGPVENQRPAPP